MQADALAYGKDQVTLRSENVPDSLIPHKFFSGNRPSMSILLPMLDAYSVGQLLSLYENRIAVQGFLWGINSFDQWGVELGKVCSLEFIISLYSLCSVHIMFALRLVGILRSFEMNIENDYRCSHQRFAVR